MRLIDADELNEYIGRESLDTREKIFALVDRMPTLPNPCGKPCAFERPHGEWLISSDKTRACCPFCHNKWTDAKEIALLDTAFRAKNFCEYCGADMRKEGEQK